ncbi:unnamed protein product [marine sediment metagenome]|uniref:Uncharacterized protein n=1 Tax=marine sediment metagenome TaxID=412755 RepID=X0X8P9_9ZZZZ
MTVSIMQFVKGVEETLLSLFLAPEEVDIVNKQHAGISVFAVEFFSFMLPNGNDKLVGKLFGADTGYRDMVSYRLMTDSVEEVSLA